MKYTIVWMWLLIFFCLPWSVFATDQGNSTPPRKKVAVVLSGGGARGMAHIGALKVIEEAGIPIDYVVGTSMGSIVGGLYAIGYTPTLLDSIVKEQDWMFLFSDRARRSNTSFRNKELEDKYIVSIPFEKKKGITSSAGLIRGLNLENLFYNLTFGYHDSISFNTLPVPFACVSVNAVNGQEYVFHSGVLPDAMRASMAIPAVFSPVRMDSMVLVDGAVANNYPADVARAMGADLIIGVDVQSPMKSYQELRTTADILGQITDFYGRDKYLNNIRNSDVYIQVNIKGFSQASFSPSAIDSLVTRGEEATREHWGDLMRMKKRARIDASQVVLPEEYEVWLDRDSFSVYSVSFHPTQEEEEEHLLKVCRLKENGQMTLRDIQQAISRLHATGLYDGVNYRLVSGKEGYHLKFELHEKQENRVRAGVRFDSEEVASVLLNASKKLNTRIPSLLALTGRLGRRSSIRADFLLRPRPSFSFNVSYMFQYNDINIYEKGSRAYNLTYAYNFAELGFMKTLGNQVKLGLGARMESYDYKGVLSDRSQKERSIKSDLFLNYYASLHYDSFDKAYFPSRGAMFRIDYSLYTDNLVTYKEGAPFSSLSLMWRGTCRLSRRFMILPALYSRVLISHNVAFPYYNMIGGDVAGHYFSQQLPFAGVNNVEAARRSVVITALHFRYRMGQNNYFSFIVNCGLEHDRFQDILGEGSDFLIGGSLGYSYDSFVGPLEFSFNFSNRTEKLGYYLNVGYFF